MPVKKKLVPMSGFKETNELGKYIGVPLTGKNPKQNNSSHLMENVKAMLTNWKANNLSFAGRVILAKFVIEATPKCTMMSCAFTKEILKKIQMMQKKLCLR